MNFFKNTILNSKIKPILIILLLLFVYIFISALSYTNAVCSNISESVFRLHVIANSDSPEDQNLKYIVRDSIISYINSLTVNASSKNEVISIVKNNLDEINQLAQKTVLENGYDYDITVNVGNFAFPTKEYGDIILPPGYYDALKIEIGEANGQNWWCVMFPPLCFVNISSGIVPDSSKQVMKDNLSDEEYSLISESSPGIEIKFKIVEVLQNFTISGIFM